MSIIARNIEVTAEPTPLPSFHCRRVHLQVQNGYPKIGGSDLTVSTSTFSNGFDLQSNHEPLIIEEVSNTDEIYVAKLTADGFTRIEMLVED